MSSMLNVKQWFGWSPYVFFTAPPGPGAAPAAITHHRVLYRIYSDYSECALKLYTRPGPGTFCRTASSSLPWSRTRSTLETSRGARENREAYNATSHGTMHATWARHARHACRPTSGCVLHPRINLSNCLARSDPPKRLVACDQAGGFGSASCGDQ